jgi:hypothetical protein
VKFFHFVYMFCFLSLHYFFGYLFVICCGCVGVFGYWKKVACSTFITHLHLFHDK